LIASADSIVVPNGLDTTDGNDGLGPWPSGDYRNQDFISSSQFNAPIRITAIYLRPDITQPSPATVSFTNHQIFFSTTSRAISAMSMTFADNIGPDNTLVSSGPLTVSTLNQPGPGTARLFDIFFPLATPYLYNPSLGNLLIDSHVTGSTGAAITQDFESGNLAVKTLFFAGAADATTGSFLSNNLFHVIRFDFQVVPEPSSLAFLAVAALAAIAIALWWWKRRCQLANACVFVQDAGSE
jgi:hypothetical protein